VRFSEPLYLLLFLPLIAGLLLTFRHVHGMAKGRKRFAFGVRFVLGALLIAALSGPEARRPNVGMATLFVLDHSDSVNQEDRERARKFVEEAIGALGPDDRAGVVVFAKEALLDAAPGGRRAYGPILTRVDGSGSNLAAAIRLATAAFPEGKARRIVVVSDGNETSGDALAATQVAATDGVTIDTVTLGRDDPGAEASVLTFEAPTETRGDEPFEVRVVVDSSTAQRGTLIVDRDGVVVKSLAVELQPGKNAIVFSQAIADAGFHRYRATLEVPKDRDHRNNVGAGFVQVRGKPKILVLQQNTTDRTLAEAIASQGIGVELRGPDGIPARAESFQDYDAVILNDINAAAFLAGQMALLATAVEDTGLGLAMIGGENSFLPGGWYGTKVADALPVDLNVRQRKTFPSTSILVLVDASGSMGMMEDGVEKIRLAAKAAEETVKLLSPVDRVGVGGSSDGIEMVAPMQRLESKGTVISQIRKLSTAGGGIYIRPTVEKAERILSAEDSKVRHFILLADGADCDSLEGSLDIIARMRANKITTSVVSIGDGEFVPFLKLAARTGGGRFYLAQRAGQLPAIFTQDAALMSRSAIEEGAFLPKVALGEETLRGIDTSSVPPLLAYCLTDFRPLARTGMKTGKDDPLLATWQYGLGTSVAFTSDAQPRWATQWVGWDGFNVFWGQVARVIGRRATRGNYQVSVAQDGAAARLEVRAFDKFGNPLDAIDADVRVNLPGGGSEPVSLAQEAPGVFRGSFDSTELGSYVVTVAEKDGTGSRVSATGYSIPYPPEYRTHRPNAPLLEGVADAGGGREIANPRDAFRPLVDPGESITELWPFVLLLAALLIPFDVGVRRIALRVPEILGRLVGLLRPKARPVPQVAVHDRLQQAKRRVTSTQPDASRPELSDPRTAEPRTPTREPVEPERTATSQGATAAGLLEAKRRRRGGNE